MEKTNTKRITNPFSIKRIVFVAAFAAITSILYAFVKIDGKFIPFFPNFLDINISMIPVIICAFMIGPWDAAICVILRCIMKWVLVGTGTGYVGEIADVLIGLAACIPAGIIYHKTSLKHKGLFALMSVVIGWVLMGIISNIFINIPWYSSFYFKTDYYKDGVPDALIGMTSDAIKTITFGKVDGLTKDNYMMFYILFAVIPFNLLLSLVVVLLTAPIHNRLHVLYGYVKIGRSKKDDEIIISKEETTSNDSIESNESENTKIEVEDNNN